MHCSATVFKSSWKVRPHVASLPGKCMCFIRYIIWNYWSKLPKIALLAKRDLPSLESPWSSCTIHVDYEKLYNRFKHSTLLCWVFKSGLARCINRQWVTHVVSINVSSPMQTLHRPYAEAWNWLCISGTQHANVSIRTHGELRRHKAQLSQWNCKSDSEIYNTHKTIKHDSAMLLCVQVKRQPAVYRKNNKAKRDLLCYDVQVVQWKSIR